MSSSRRAIAGFEARGEAARTADAKIQLYIVLRAIEPSPAIVAILDEVIATLEASPPGQSLVDACAMRAGWGYVADIHDDVFLWAGKSLALADELNLPANPTALRTRAGSGASPAISAVWTNFIGASTSRRRRD